MLNLTYEWKVDIAILLTLFNLAINAITYILRSRAKRKEARTRVYEKVYEDASFLVEYPYRQKLNAKKSRFYSNDNVELQTAVRIYLDAEIMGKSWALVNSTPSNLTGDERLEFISLVQKEAARYRNEADRVNLDIRGPDLSPAYHLEDKEVSVRLVRIIKHVGGNLSSFSKEIRRSWESIKFMNPSEVRGLYEQSLQFCPNYFKYNPRGFDDPFHDLPEAIRREYRALTLTKTEKIKRKLWRPWWKIQSRGEALLAILKFYSWQIRDRLQTLGWKFEDDYLRAKILIRQYSWKDFSHNSKRVKI
jgi:hypothetical protein